MKNKIIKFLYVISAVLVIAMLLIFMSDPESSGISGQARLTFFVVTAVSVPVLLAIASWMDRREKRAAAEAPNISGMNTIASFGKSVETGVSDRRVIKQMVEEGLGNESKEG